MVLDDKLYKAPIGDNPQWADLFYDAGDQIGCTFRVCGGILEESAKKAGFKKIVHKEYTIPIAG
ncbi:hypothetical protein CDV36_006855 [Fusarium kuroshium]|uniref:Uncharacterized protein n=1 Tax=Fusarium kuroshium TaxID=2010991 RepID=A0A3M2S7F7_9HYPO|nr:hypothetical protein CDV36_006855 [Fusarium kuroshium]